MIVHNRCKFYIKSFLENITAAVHGGTPWSIQDGQEFEYQSTITSAAGTMDVATHSAGEQYKMKVRIQSAGNKLNVKVNLNCNF